MPEMVVQNVDARLMGTLTTVSVGVVYEGRTLSCLQTNEHMLPVAVIGTPVDGLWVVVRDVSEVAIHSPSRSRSSISSSSSSSTFFFFFFPFFFDLLGAGAS